MKKRKKKSDKQKLEEKLWELCKKYIRARDHMICQKCNKKILNPQGADTSHVLCKNRYKSLKYDEYNLKLMCMSCHKWWHNMPTESGEWFKQKFPDRWGYLQESRKTIRKFGIVQLQETIEDYEDKLVGIDMGEL